jgi:hypothetical protein
MSIGFPHIWGRSEKLLVTSQRLPGSPTPSIQPPTIEAYRRTGTVSALTVSGRL